MLAWQRWLVAYAASLAASFLVGRLTALGVGNALFIAGGLATFASIGFIGLGGERTVTHRDIRGYVISKETLAPEKRRAQLRTGMAIFGLAIALWIAIVPVHLFFSW